MRDAAEAEALLAGWLAEWAGDGFGYRASEPATAPSSPSAASPGASGEAVPC
jgi:hypothetical protein